MPTEATVHLLPRRSTGIRLGRRWVYKTEVERIEGDPAAGDAVAVCDHRGRFLARGFFNPRSMLMVRLMTQDPDQAIDERLIRRRIIQAWEFRQQILPPSELKACRVAFAEADGLPGLIIDRFGDVLVLQTLCLGMDRFKPAILETLCECLTPRAVFERNDAPVRELEGLPRAKGVLYGTLPDEIWVEEAGVAVRVDVVEGQKTGHFLDQRFNRIAFGRLPLQGRVLDAFCYNGGFGLQALAAGADQCIFLDWSPSAVAAAMAGAQRAGNHHRAQGIVANAFDQLRAWEKSRTSFDAIVLDPPAFARSRSALEGAYRGYKEINLRALRLLRPGGLLVTSSCSQPVSWDMFLEVLKDAAADAGRRVRLIDRRGAAPDHPGLLGADETLYLKCAFLQVVDD